MYVLILHCASRNGFPITNLIATSKCLYGRDYNGLVISTDSTFTLTWLQEGLDKELGPCTEKNDLHFIEAM